jgi:hypothetical protein
MRTGRPGTWHPGTWLTLATAIATAACSSGPKPDQAASNPDVYPKDYQRQIAMYLRTELTDRADFRGAMIAEPAMKPVGTSQHYVVCLRFNGHNQRKDRAVVYLAGDITQFLDSKPEQCGAAVFTPFQTLDDIIPPE